MRDTLVFLQDVDLARHAQVVGDLVKNAELWLLGIIVSALVCVGHRMAIGHRVVYGWGIRLAALTFLGYATYAVVQAGDVDQAAEPVVLCRAAIAAGSVLALSWILLPVIFFVYGNFRFGLVGFWGYAGYAMVTAEALDSEALPGIAVRGLLVAALAMIVAWILRPIWEFVAAYLPARPVPAAEPVSPEGKPALSQPRLSRRERRRRLARLQDEPEATTAQPAAETPSALELECRRRRNKARLDAELAYLLALPQYGNQFPRELFDRWMVHYLGEHLTVEEVEENSLHFQHVLRQQARESNAYFTLEDFHGWFVEEQDRIQTLNLDPTVRQTKLIALQELYLSLSQRFLAEPVAVVVPMLGRRQLPQGAVAVGK